MFHNCADTFAYEAIILSFSISLTPCSLRYGSSVLLLTYSKNTYVCVRHIPANCLHCSYKNLPRRQAQSTKLKMKTTFNESRPPRTMRFCDDWAHIHAWECAVCVQHADQPYMWAVNIDRHNLSAAIQLKMLHYLCDLNLYWITINTKICCSPKICVDSQFRLNRNSQRVPSYSRVKMVSLWTI